MIDPAEALKVLSKAGVHFYSGVPDSLLKEFNACVTEQVDPTQHVVAHNEGGAVALAAGHYLATGDLGLVYMQNSGLGNAVNPLVSLTSAEVYGIPMVLMIGWRGQPGRPDEPQHHHQGRVTKEMLAMLDVPVKGLDSDTREWVEILEAAVETAIRDMGPTALLVSAGTFGVYQTRSSAPPPGEGLPLRIDAISTVLDSLDRETIFVATTGYTARELSALRLARGESDDHDFLMVGSMGHAASLALGLAMARPDVKVVCLDGDGALAMHLGVLALAGDRGPANLGHVLFNNGVHESVGGQRSALASADTLGIAEASGYRSVSSCDDLGDLARLVRDRSSDGGPWFVEIQLRQGTVTDLPRPDEFSERLARLRGVLDS